NISLSLSQRKQNVHLDILQTPAGAVAIQNVFLEGKKSIQRVQPLTEAFQSKNLTGGAENRSGWFIDPMFISSILAVIPWGALLTLAFGAGLIYLFSKHVYKSNAAVKIQTNHNRPQINKRITTVAALILLLYGLSFFWPGNPIQKASTDLVVETNN